MFRVGGLVMQIWEFNCGGEHGKRMEGSDISQDKSGVWVRCLNSIRRKCKSMSNNTFDIILHVWNESSVKSL